MPFLTFTKSKREKENFLIDCEGHIKLGDFGLSKEGLENQYKETLTFKANLKTTLKKLDYKTRLASYKKEKEKYHSIVGRLKKSGTTLRISFLLITILLQFAVLITWQ